MSLDFASGSSVMHSVDVELVAQRQAIYDKHCESKKGNDNWSCVVTAYIWNPKLKTRAFLSQYELNATSIGNEAIDWLIGPTGEIGRPTGGSCELTVVPFDVPWRGCFDSCGVQPSYWS